MMNEQKRNRGILSSLKVYLDHNRLGDLLVTNGTITQYQLEDALRQQKRSGMPLGAILREQGLITTTGLRFTLFQQVAWRGLAAAVAFFISFSAMGVQSARATSASAQDRGLITMTVSHPEGAQLENVSLNRQAPARPAEHHAALFGTSEVRSADVSPFTKWTGILARLNDSNTRLPDALQAYKNASESDKVEAVNAFFNKVRYIEDKNNWGSSDYWETPAEFTSRGGDCEDFAIAKYSALKSLGFSENQLRIAIVQDTWKGLPHAILIVYTADGAKFLDNQYKTVKDAENFDRYRPVYSINRTGWWRHVS